MFLSLRADGGERAAAIWDQAPVLQEPRNRLDAAAANPKYVGPRLGESILITDFPRLTFIFRDLFPLSRNGVAVSDRKSKGRPQAPAKGRHSAEEGGSGGVRQTPTPGQVRIIAGTWRGRKLPVADMHGLRPSGDRTRETLFNWLQALIPGSRCLDLFAGSGALGLEAASRGAAQVVMIERDSSLMRQLSSQCQILGAGEGVRVFCEDALAFLAGSAAQGAPWDVVFVDPPWASAIQNQVLQLLHGRQQQGHLLPGARVYVEMPLAYELVIPGPWECLRERQFGQARAVLLRVV